MKKTLYFFVLSFFIIGIYGSLTAQCTKVKTLTNITMENGSCIHLINGYDFLMEADANGTSSLIDRNTSNHVTHATGGQSVDQIYVEQDNWHYISSPMQNEVTGAFLDMYLYDWDETAQVWTWHSVVYDPLTPMKGWALWSPSSTGSQTRTYEGDFNTGNQSFNPTRNDPNGACPIGANLVGNPYPSSINWEKLSAWTTTNISPTIYLWNSTTGNTGTYNRNTDLSQNGVDSIIPPKQGFFISVTTGNTSGYIEVSNEARVHCENRPVYKANTNIVFPNLLQLNVSTDVTGYSDEAFIVFNEKASNDFDDNFDAFKIKGAPTAPQLYTTWYGTEYAVNTLSKIEENLTVPLNFEAGIDGDYAINVNTENLPIGTELYLEDKKQNKWHDLQTNSTYHFTAATVDEAGRFLLHFGAPNAMDEITSTNNTTVYSFKKDIHIHTLQGFKGEVKIYDLLGQEILAQKIYNEETIITIDYPANYYVVKVISIAQDATQSVSTHKVFIK